jgi:hypothetical protein
MTIYFAGGEMGAFIPSDSTVTEAGSVSHYNSSFARTALYATKDANYFESPELTGLTDAWIHFDLSVGSALVGEGKRFSWYDTAGTERIRLIGDNAGDMTLQYNVGAGFVTVGSVVSAPLSNVTQTIDIHVVCNSASGSIHLYLSGTERVAGTGIDLSAITELNKVRFTGKLATGSLGADTFASQVIVADEPTIGWRLTTVPATGAGATTDWTGGYTEIDEVAYSDADFINSATANQVELFSHSTAVPSGYAVRAVAVTARAKCGASGPQNIQLALRSAGTTYFSASKALDVGYEAFVNIWETDPATSADFTASAIAALQFGVKSIT